MRVLLTRPPEQAEKTAARLQALGHEVVRQSLLQRHILQAAPPAGTFDVVVFTSVNGVEAAVANGVHSVAQNAVVFVPGPATEAAAQKAGFNHVVNARGNALVLVEKLKNWLGDWKRDRLCRILYPASTLPAHAPGPLLEGYPCQVADWPVYEMAEATMFDDSVLKQLSDGRIDLVLLYSARTARVFAKLAPELPKGTKIYAFSREIIAALPPELAVISLASPTPDEDSLLALLNIP